MFSIEVLNCICPVGRPALFGPVLKDPLPTNVGILTRRQHPFSDADRVPRAATLDHNSCCMGHLDAAVDASNRLANQFHHHWIGRKTSAD